jgi:hypothetical protein
MKKLSVSSIHKFRKHWESVGMQVQIYYSEHYSVKKKLDIFRPQPVFNLPNAPSSGKIKLFQATEGLVSDIPAGDWKMDNLFLQCSIIYNLSCRIIMI